MPLIVPETESRKCVSLRQYSSVCTFALVHLVLESRRYRII